MSLKLPPPPNGTQDVVAVAMKRAHASGQYIRSGAAGGAAVVTPVAPHQVYSIGLTQTANGEGLAAAKLVGWRAIVVEGKNPVAAVEFSSSGGAPGVFKSYNQGSQVQSTASAIAMAEGIPQVKTKDFEPRLLQIPSIYLLSLWLHGAQENLFIPLDPTPSGFKPYVVYSEADFFNAAAIQAKRRLTSDTRPQGTPPPRRTFSANEPPPRNNEPPPAAASA